MRTRSRSRHKIAEPLRIEFHSQEDQFQEDPPDVPMSDNRTMAQLLQAPTVGYEDAIFIPEIAATNFELKHSLINLVQNKQFFGHDKEDPHAHIRYFNNITSTMSVPNAVVAKVNSNSSTPAISSDVAEVKDMVRALLLDKKNQSSAQATSPTPALVKAIESNCVTCGGSHSYKNCLATSGNVYQDNIHEYVSQAAAPNYNQGNTGFRPQMVINQIRPPGFPPVQNNQNNFNRGNNFTQNRGGNFSQSSFNQSQLHRPQVNQALAYQAPIPQTQRSGTLPGNTVTNPKEDLKGITTRSGVAYNGPTIPIPSKVVKQGIEVTKDQVQTPSPQSTAHVQPPVTQSETPVFEPIASPVSAPMPNLKPSIPYPSRRDNERRREQANEQIEKFYKIFKDMSFEISFTDAQILIPKFAPTLKALIRNKEKLSKMAQTSMNEHCSAVILNNRLGASINLMSLSVWKELTLPELTPTSITLGLADRSVSKPIGIAKVVSVKVAITYNLDQTSRYSANYDQMTANKIDVTDEACEEYFQEVFGFSNVTVSGSPTPSDDPIVSTTSPTLTPFGNSNFLLFEEANAFLDLEDDPDLPELDPSYYDPEGDIQMLKAILNSDPTPSLPNHEQSVPSFTNEFKACEAKMIKSSVDEPLEVELKDLPPHLEYAFLEGDNKFPVIIAKELGDEEKAAQIKVRNKRVKDKIGTKPDQIKKKREAWKSPEVSKTNYIAKDDETSKDKEIDKLMALISLSFKKIYKPTNNNLRTSSNTSRANQDNSPRINRNVGYENQRIGNVAGARENVGLSVVQKSGIQCYNCKEFRHVARECQKPKRAKDAAYHREKMLLCKQEEAGIQLNAEQADWRDDIDDDELEDQELDAHYMYMAQLQEVSPDAADSGPIFDDEPLQKVSNDDHYNVFAMESTHPEQSKSVHDTYPIEQDAQNVIIDSLDMSNDREEIDQNDDDNDLANERELLASLIKKLKCAIYERKNRNKFLETSNKVLIEKLRAEIKDFKNKNNSLKSSNKFFKEANNKLSERNNLMYADYKKSKAELARRNSTKYASQMEL
nr:reverse transcriptase domain-containing protein [Tanacetum cinerariifolium]